MGDTLFTNFATGNDFFQLLVRVLKEVLMTGSHKHLDNFYLIVPAMLASYADNAIQGKDSMNKPQRGIREAHFTDDGFAMGVAYILAILNQGSKFDALHLQESLDDYIRAEEMKLAERQKVQENKIQKRQSAVKKSSSWFSSKPKTVDAEAFEEDEEFSQLVMNSKRIQSLKREFSLFFFTLTGSRIFFKASRSTSNDFKGKNISVSTAQTSTAQTTESTKT